MSENQKGREGGENKQANTGAAASCRFKNNAITEEPASLQSYSHSTGAKLSRSIYVYIAPQAYAAGSKTMQRQKGLQACSHI